MSLDQEPKPDQPSSVENASPTTMEAVEETPNRLKARLRSYFMQRVQMTKIHIGSCYGWFSLALRD